MNNCWCEKENEGRCRENNTNLDDIEDLLEKIICLLKKILDELEDDRKRR